jgi:hypothetical protein
VKVRVAALLVAMTVTGCGKAAPQSDMPARTWQYYAAHPEAIEPMQSICREWASSGAPAGSEPAFAKSQRQIGS